MPRLYNRHDFDLFAAGIHRNVPALDSIQVSDAEAELFADNSVLVVLDDEPETADGASAEADDPEAAETSPEGAGSSRRTVTRGGSTAEVSAAPVQETR